MAEKKGRKSLEEYLQTEYTFHVIADPDGGYVIKFPDLPGCLSQADSPEEIVPMAMDAKRGWITVMYEDGNEIPEPAYPDLEEYSGQFRIRLPKSLHRKLAEQAKVNGVSLNTWLVHLLSERSAEERRGQAVTSSEPETRVA